MDVSFSFVGDGGLLPKSSTESTDDSAVSHFSGGGEDVGVSSCSLGNDDVETDRRS